MKRDMDLIRHILFEVERLSNPWIERINPPDGIDYETLDYHVRLLRDAGLVEADIIDSNARPNAIVTIRGLTWAGHDFLDSARDETLWRKAKEYVLKPSASWTFSILSEWLKREIHARVFGLRID